MTRRAIQSTYELYIDILIAMADIQCSSHERIDNVAIVDVERHEGHDRLPQQPAQPSPHLGNDTKVT